MATVNYMQGLADMDAKERAAGSGSKPCYSSDPRGTIAFLTRLAELVEIMRHSRAHLRIRRVTDARLEQARAIVKEFRVVAQQAAAAWGSREAWCVTPHLKSARQLFLAPQTLSALDNTVETYAGAHAAEHA